MRIPRLRLKLRTLMLIIAVAALAMPVVFRLIWLCQRPPSRLHSFALKLTPIRSTERGRQPFAPYPVGQPVEIRFSYYCTLLPVVPTGLPYRVSVATSLLDPASAVVETHQTSHVLIAGTAWWEWIDGEFGCRLTPIRPGRHTVQYELIVTDVFGRKTRSVFPSGQFSVK
jgi:hypothetical protein